MLSKGFLIYLFLFCHLIVSKKLRTPALDTLKSEKLNECGRCKVLTDSFNHWLEKTSRGKYEGGDTAWEEAKLKSYARSEIRLVEVQEGLCSELNRHQDDCYMLSEEADQLLEKWWFHEDPKTVDLHSWLCIDNLKLCCPMNHFGESCELCPLDKDNKICSGHGKCDGEGTRNGSGLCVCNRGYIGNSCEECSKNFYARDGSCEKCDRSCEGCSGAGSAACLSCNTGWKQDGGVCADIDECLSSSTCKSDQYCVNREGSFSCKSCHESCKSCWGPGPLNCTLCEPPNIPWSGKCVPQGVLTEFLESAIQRVALYMGIILMSIFIQKRSRLLASIIVIFASIYICYTENAFGDANIFNVLTNHYFS